MLLEAVFVGGIGLVLSVVNVYFRDTEHFVGIAMMALFYSTPIVYPITYVPKTAHVLGMDDPAPHDLRAQPARHASSSRTETRCTTSGSRPIGDLAYLVAWAVVLLAFGLWVFGKLDRRLAEEL